MEASTKFSFRRTLENRNSGFAMPTVPTLGDMMRHAGNDHACQSSDAMNLTKQAVFVTIYAVRAP